VKIYDLDGYVEEALTVDTATAGCENGVSVYRRFVAGRLIHTEGENVSQAKFKWPSFRRILPDFLAFAVGLGVAWFLGWRTTDLVWSLWLSSLVLGYLTILSTIGAGVGLGVMAVANDAFPPRQRSWVILLGSASALYLFGFFSLHFCAFHAGHAAGLSTFFPIKDLPAKELAYSFWNPIRLWKTVFQYLLPVYGLFLIPAIVAERKAVFASVLEAVEAIRDGSYCARVQDFVKLMSERKKPSHDPFVRPYINVLRMHLLIFFFAFCAAMKAESYIVYGVVYFVYFFPWTAFKDERLPIRTRADLKRELAGKRAAVR
jgi:hypothetical protein